MKSKELAYALGISAAMVSKLAKRGMPTHSIEEAEKWRKKNLDPTRTKQNRADSNQGGRRAKPGQRPRPVGSASIAQAVAADPRPFDTFMQEVLPASLFQPLAIAAIMDDAGIQITGQQAMHLTAHLFMYYMGAIDPSGEEMQFVIPKGLNLRPGTPEYEAEVKGIESFIASVNRG